VSKAAEDAKTQPQVCDPSPYHYNDSKTPQCPSATTTPTNPGVSRGWGSKDATADVTAMHLTAPDAIGFSYANVTITNHSEGRSNYYIELSVESFSGSTQYDTTFVAVNDLEPGQTTTAKSMPISHVPALAVARVKTVQRTAAS
jgi:hypothetical protein